MAASVLRKSPGVSLGARAAWCFTRPEPLLRYTLCPIAFLGLGVTLFFGFVLNEPGFPKWGMLGFSVGALLAYWLYLAVLFSLERLISK